MRYRRHCSRQIGLITLYRPVCQKVRSMASWSLSRRLWRKLHGLVSTVACPAVYSLDYGLNVLLCNAYFVWMQANYYCVPNTRHWDDSLYLLQRPGCCSWPPANDSSAALVNPAFHCPPLIHLGRTTKADRLQLLTANSPKSTFIYVGGKLAPFDRTDIL